MQNVLEVKNLTKKYKDAGIENINFNVPKGSIVGLIGRNGAGKTTIIKTILDITKKDSGEVIILDDNTFSIKTRNDIGVVFDGDTFHDSLNIIKLNKILKNIYKDWNEEKYFNYANNMKLPLNKKFKQFSKGMKMKYAISVAFSHHSMLLILDEATGGLDPIMRDEILDMFLDFIQDEENSILVSSHITSDLEKVADYIVFIHKGKLVFSKSKDELLENYGILKCGANLFDEIEHIKEEESIAEAILEIKEKYGKNALLKASSLLPDSTIKSRNEKIGGHQA